MKKQNLILKNNKAEVEAALRERVKELTCLYGISQIANDLYEISQEEILSQILELLPPAWQYPDITTAKIYLDNKEYLTKPYSSGSHEQVEEIVIKGIKRGFVKVEYTDDKPDMDEGPFLNEERSLIKTIAREIGHIIERKDNDEEKSRFQVQLQHADRLATVGKLSAGVAHELNEPLNSILGFAQLLEKNENLSKQGKGDIHKIINSSLHAREVIKKLMFFSRQMPTEKKKINLNLVIEEGLYFLEARCIKKGIRITKCFTENLFKIIADPVQVNQILVNLVVNSIQAMPGGGELIITTCSDKDFVSMIVEDSGIGMSKETQGQLFQPFFTTKDIGQGTGLGLSVVHGIVESHNGLIEVESSKGNGSKFEVKFPALINKKNRQ